MSNKTMLGAKDVKGVIADLLEKLCSENGEAWLVEAKLFLRKNPCWVSSGYRESLVRVDRTIRSISYPEWMDSLANPEVENIGPKEFDARTLEHWLHDDQKPGVVTGRSIYGSFHPILGSDDLVRCLNLRDLEEIQKRGATFFSKHFKGKSIFGWKSVICDGADNHFVPCLFIEVEDVAQVKLDWISLESDFFSEDVAALFPVGIMKDF